jgi:hypothetical protein
MTRKQWLRVYEALMEHYTMEDGQKWLKNISSYVGDPQY